MTASGFSIFCKARMMVAWVKSVLVVGKGLVMSAVKKVQFLGWLSLCADLINEEERS